MILARANGQPFEKSGYPARNVKMAIDLAARDLLVGNHVSNEALILAAKPLVPTWLFMFFANRGWKQQAKAYSVEDKLYGKVNKEKNGWFARMQ